VPATVTGVASDGDVLVAVENSGGFVVLDVLNGGEVRRPTSDEGRGIRHPQGRSGRIEGCATPCQGNEWCPQGCEESDCLRCLRQEA